MRNDVGVGSDDLLLGFEGQVLLEFEIAQGAREGEVAVDTAEFDKAACRGDTGRLLCAISTRAMVAEQVESCNDRDIPLFVGLWSCDSALASPLYPKTARESPEFACHVSRAA